MKKPSPEALFAAEFFRNLFFEEVRDRATYILAKTLDCAMQEGRMEAYKQVLSEVKLKSAGLLPDGSSVIR